MCPDNSLELKKLWMFIAFQFLYYNEFENGKFGHAWVIYWNVRQIAVHHK